jgi:peptidoglycan/LPS O-acetylase OafA/YrhL
LEASKYIKSIDGLRAIAVMGVLASHFGVYRTGWLGVQLFFVISGYLIISILLREKEADRPVSFLLKRFYYRRSLRIFPLYYFYLLLLVLVYTIVFHNPAEIMQKIPSLMTYMYNLTRISPTFHYTDMVNHLWSLCVEEQFYLMFPFIIFFVSTKNLKRLFVFILVFSPVFRVLLFQYCKMNGYKDFDAGDIVYVYTPSHFDAFVSGGIITLFSLDKKLKTQLVFWIFTILFMVSGVINAVTMGENYFTNLGYGILVVENYQHVWSYTISNFFFASIILLLVSPQENKLKKALSTVLASRPFVAVGKVSYGMYIYHWLILYFFTWYFRFPKLINFTIYSCIVFAVSWVSFWMFEVKLINLKDKYFKLEKQDKPQLANN